MPAPRLTTSLLLRTSRTLIPIAARQSRAVTRPAPRATRSVIKITQFRSYSQDLKPSKIYFFEDIKSHLANPSPNRILIDTREPSELHATGTIPGSLNIPITSQPDSFHIKAEEFEDRFGFERPGKEQEVVFYCKAGVRSRAAAELARQAGWVNVGEYSGSWLDWEKNAGEKEGGR